MNEQIDDNSSATCWTDCRSENEIEVGLIDGIIAMARSIHRTHIECYETRQAFEDLQDDEDVKWLMSNKEKN